MQFINSFYVTTIAKMKGRINSDLRKRAIAMATTHVCKTVLEADNHEMGDSVKSAWPGIHSKTRSDG